MTDINPDVPDKPVEVAPSALPDQAATGGRDLLLLVGLLPALVAVLGTRDVKQIVDWLAGNQGIAFLGLAITILTPLWRQWLARRKHADLKFIETKVGNDIVKTKGS